MAELKLLITKQGPIKNSTEDDFRIGSGTFSDDIWDFKDVIAKDFEHLKGGKLRLNFSEFAPYPRIQKVIKHYILSELTLCSFNSVKRKLAGFAHLPTFLNQNEHIQSFKDFTANEFKLYLDFTVDLPLSGVSKKKIGQVMKELLLRGSMRSWDTVVDTVGIERLYDELIIQNKQIKDDTKFGATKKVLPKSEIVDLLINTANEHISQNHDEFESDNLATYKYLKTRDYLTALSIILMTQLGFRLSECLTIKFGCLKVINGEYQIVYTTRKTKKDKTEVTRPANELVVNAVRKLEEYSKPLRDASGMPYLFLYKSRHYDPITKDKPVCLADHNNWTRNNLKKFIEKYNIRDEKENHLKLTSHYFRHIFATYALKDGMRLHDVAEMLNHESIIMTETYDHTKGKKQKVIEKILTGETPISSTNRIVLESIEGDENPFKGKTVEQVEKMRKALKIELLPHGLCLHHPMRGEPCAQDGVCLGCNEFIASADHLPVYEKRLEKVEKELSDSPADSVYSTKLHYQQGKLIKYISDLQLKIAMKEANKSD
ncbi:site-specific integrase [Lysinibacillus sp. JNUCC 51]|uniref:site-specific integrase n=1 Tax=Lysinibacillus sp. JNUCC-51 TaxID=2792479 RepID=UPI00193612E4|nr:site-specific integrase [Lysinibacillus sp. JNUCC-51]